MAVYTGTLADFGLAALTPFAPLMVFTADQAAFSGGNVLVTRPVPAPIATDGSFSVELVPSVNTTPNVTYSMRVEWLDSASNYIGMDIIGGLVTALGGGLITEMGGIPITRFWAGETPPDNPEPDTWWLDIITGNLNEWI